MSQPEQNLEPEDHFESLAQQKHAVHLGMWLFLTSEVLLFGALFGLYTAYRIEYTREFTAAAHHNNLLLGTTNTLILITSSFTAAWAVHSVGNGRRSSALVSLGATLLMGVAFLVIKGVEYAEHFAHGIFPGALYAYHELPTHGANLFFTLYYFMTGLHALHVIAGIAALAVVMVVAARGGYSARKHTSLELSVLYWHLVDAVWIFLWPLLYLVG